MEKLLGQKLWTEILNLTSFDVVNEIRIRLNHPILIKCKNKTFFLPYIPDKEYLNKVIDVATGYSRYAYEREISDGYLEYGEGVRIGLCGTGKINDKKLIVYSSVTSLCIRIPHAIQLNKSIKSVLDNFNNTLIIGAPYSGKTTLIRALSEELAENSDVVIIDERREIAGSNFSLLKAKRADIIQGIPKNEIYGNIIRSMSPSIVVCDELFSEKDFFAVEKIKSAGIKCLASYHSNDIYSIPEIANKIFSVFVTLNSNPAPGSITSIVRKND